MQQTIFMRRISLFFVFFSLFLPTVYSPLLAASPPAFVFEIDGGVNFFTGDKKEVTNRHNLEKFGSQVALSLNVKTGVLFQDHYLIFLAFSYDKLRDFNYQLNAIVQGAKHQYSYKKYSVGIDSVFFAFPYRSKYNIGFSIDNHAAMLFQRISRIDVNFTTIDEVTTENVTQFYIPVNRITYAYMLRPEIKFHIRLTEISTIYLAFSYSVLMPTFLHYPSVVLGIDAHFDLMKKPE